MDDYDPRKQRVIAEKYRQYVEASQPIIRAMCKIYILAIPRYSLHADGRFEKVDDGLTDTEEDALRRYDELLEFTAGTFGFKRTEVDGTYTFSYVGPLDL